MESLRYGYARVSTKEQNLERQIDALRENGIEERNIITDKESGKDFNREGYILLKSKLLRRGDTLVIKELDRLGRDMEQIKKEWQELKDMGIDIEILDMPILNTKDKTDLEKTLISNIVLELLAYVAESERLKIRQRQREGIDRLKARNGGKGIGRPRKEFPPNWKEVYTAWKQGKVTAVTAMEYLGLKKNTFYRLVKKQEELDAPFITDNNDDNNDK